jgi:hypothetical protein
MGVEPGTLKNLVKHAFHVDPPGPAEPTAEEQAPVDWFCRQVARKHLTTPGLIGLEMARPLNYIAGQTMRVLSPAVWAIARQQTHESYTHFAEFLERRGSMEYLCQRIEHFEAEFEKKQREAQASRRAAAAADAGTGEAREEDHDTND